MCHRLAESKTSSTIVRHQIFVNEIFYLLSYSITIPRIKNFTIKLGEFNSERTLKTILHRVQSFINRSTSRAKTK